MATSDLLGGLAERRRGAGEVLEQRLQLLWAEPGEHLADQAPSRADGPVEVERAGDGLDVDPAAVGRVDDAAHMPRVLKPVDEPSGGAGGQAGAFGQLTRGEATGKAEHAQRVPVGGVEPGRLGARLDLHHDGVEILPVDLVTGCCQISAPMQIMFLCSFCRSITK